MGLVVAVNDSEIRIPVVDGPCLVSDQVGSHFLNIIADDLKVEGSEETFTEFVISYLPQRDPMESDIHVLLRIRNCVDGGAQYAVYGLEFEVGQWVEDCQVLIANYVKNYVRLVEHEVFKNLLYLQVFEYFNCVSLARLL